MSNRLYDLRKRGRDVLFAAGAWQGTFSPANLTVPVQVETVTVKSMERLQISSAAITHVVHVRREDLTGHPYTGTGLAQFATLTLVDGPSSGQTFRVEYAANDPTSHAVQFHCITV